MCEGFSCLWVRGSIKLHLVRAKWSDLEFCFLPSLVRILYHCRLTSPPLPPIAFFLDKQIDNPNRVKRIFCFCLTLVCVHGAFQENPYHLQAGCCQGLVPPVFQNCTGHWVICGESKKCTKVTFNISPWGWLASKHLIFLYNITLESLIKVMRVKEIITN